MGLNYNNNVDQDLLPNQASVGEEFPNNNTATTNPPPIRRKGTVTLVNLIGDLTAPSTVSFGTVEDEGWLPGDTVFITKPSNANASGNEIDIENINGDLLVTWSGVGPTNQDGGMFVFGETDFFAVIPGSVSNPADNSSDQVVMDAGSLIAGTLTYVAGAGVSFRATSKVLAIRNKPDATAAHWGKLSIGAITPGGTGVGSVVIDSDNVADTSSISLAIFG